MTVSRNAIVQEARSWLGTPYHHQARLKHVAVDCIGLPIVMAWDFGTLPRDFDIKGYSRQPDGTLLARANEHLVSIDPRELRPGDIVATIVEIEPAHFGIVGDYRAGELSLIHAQCHKDGSGQVYEHRIDAGQRRRIAGAWLFPGVEA